MNRREIAKGYSVIFGQALVQHEGPQRIAGSRDQILPAIHHKSLRRIADLADPRVPQRLSLYGIIGH